MVERKNDNSVAVRATINKKECDRLDDIAKEMSMSRSELIHKLIFDYIYRHDAFDLRYHGPTVLDGIRKRGC